jgi:hypothetical protein
LHFPPPDFSAFVIQLFREHFAANDQLVNRPSNWIVYYASFSLIRWRKFMLEKGHYEISLDAPRAILKLRLYGFWDTVVAKQYVADLEKHAQTLSTGGNGWSVLTDVTHFPPQQPDIQVFLNEALTAARQHGAKKVARVAANNHITKMQLSRLSREAQIQEFAFFQTEEAAMQWLLN